MLLAALGATVIGFILLIVALITGNLWLAIACVVVSVVGVVLLLGDVLTYRRAERDESDGEGSWSPGTDGSDQDTESGAAAAADRGAGPAAAVAGGSVGAAAGASAAGAAPASGAAAELDDAAREAGTVGHEEFGRHDAPDDDARPTTQFARGPLGGESGWDHETPADTDDDSTRGLFAPGEYDPDMTDQIPQIEVDRAWGSQWTAPEDPDKK
ncbi:hypothetical protein GCM10027289_05580 [Tsukamurella serpentis]